MLIKLLIYFHLFSYCYNEFLDCIPYEFCGLVWDSKLPCCSNSDSNKQPLTSTIASTTITTPISITSPSISYIQPTATDTYLTTKADNECGSQMYNTLRQKRKINEKTTFSRIYGGDVVNLKEFPWLALIFYQKTNETICSATIINKYFLLTAGHCISGVALQLFGKPNYVRLGENDLNSLIDCDWYGCADQPLDINIKKLYPHPRYLSNSKNQHNDIGLIQLANYATYSDFIQPICLPASNFTLNEGTEMFASGWGKTESGGTSQLKLTVKLPIKNNAECLNNYKGFQMNAGQLCAGGDLGKDTCRGDSGGPLMYFNGKSWIIYGIVSIGPKICGQKNFPAIYTKASYFSDWILKISTLN